MKNSNQEFVSETVCCVDNPEVASESASTSEVRDVLTQILREGAQKMLQAAIQREVDDYLQNRSGIVGEDGRRLVIRNGSLPERELTTGLGPIQIRQPRVRDKRAADEREVFHSSILPKYLRKTKSIEELVPWLYLKGISTNDFPEALQALLGKDAAGFSATTITRLKSIWEGEYDEWSKRSLKDKRYVYFWADGIYSNIRFNDNEGRGSDENRQCLLVLMGATADGTKELIAVVDGVRESELSWKELLLNVKARGLRYDPLLAIGDGALGFWKALHQVFPTTHVQRCTVHKTANVLDKIQKSVQPQAKRMLHSIWDAPTKAEADKAFDLFIRTFEAKYAAAVECLRKDRDVLLTFYNFPADNWCHIRTTNPIESTFATIRLRHRKTKNNGSAKASTVMIFKLAQSAAKGWRKLRGHQHIPELIKGVRFIDGINEQSVDELNSSTTKSHTTHTEVVA
ncbi:MAG: IS256 family transposase [Planctomycetaceae bacterium]